MRSLRTAGVWLLLLALLFQSPGLDVDETLSPFEDDSRPCAVSIPLAMKHGAYLQIFLVLFSKYFDLLQGKLMERQTSVLKEMAITVANNKDLTLKYCPQALGLAELVRLEMNLMAVFPVASEVTPLPLFAAPVSEAQETMGTIAEDAELEPKDAEGEWLLREGLARMEALLKGLRQALAEPWHAVKRKWIQDPELWHAFSVTGRLTITPIHPTPLQFDATFGAVRKHLRGRTPEAVAKGWREISVAMRAAAGENAEWWPISGTLLALLRYGQLHGFLAEGKVDVVDDDIDIILVQPSVRSWLRFCVAVTTALQGLGWHGCAHMLTGSAYTNQTRRLVEMDVDRRGRPELFCIKLAQDADVILNVQLALPVQTVQQREGGNSAAAAKTKGCPKAFSGRGAPTCRAAVMGPVHLLSDSADVHQASLTEELFCFPEGSLHGRGCWSLSYNFQSFPDQVLPPDFRHPMARCAAFGGTTACPAKAVELLKSWGGGEYWKASPNGEYPCLALPDVGCPAPQEMGTPSWKIDRQEEDPRNQRLAEEGLIAEDMSILRQRWQQLRSQGFLVHNFTGCNWARCLRPKARDNEIRQKRLTAKALPAFEDLDTDADGVISRKEYEAAFG